MLLVACPSCSVYVRGNERSCPHCGHQLRDEGGLVSRTAGAVLMGLALTACPAADDGDSGDDSAAMSGSSSEGSTTDEWEPDPATNGGGASDYGGPVTEGWGTTSGSDETSSTGGSTGATTGEGSTGGTTTGGSTGEATSGSSGEASTGIGEPEYGVPTTGE
ncbi:MAG: hypothetical protein ACE37F_24645 [Nannocystaceae bacterium]|nr:hypothetical protein [bacterium]